MRILQVSNFFKPMWETGGVTKVSYEVSSHLVKAGHDVTVYTTDGYNSQFENRTNVPLDIDGIRVYYFKNLFKSVVRKVNLTFPYHLPFVLRKEIKNFDIIHIHEHRTVSAAIVHYYAKKHGVPYVLQSHGSVLTFFQKSKLKKIFDFFFGYSILNNASKVIALTAAEANQYMQMGMDESKIVIIPNGINIEEFENLPNKGEFKRKYSITDNERIILYLGRIDIIKGIDLLIDSFSDLVNKVDNIRLVVVGPSSDYLPILKQKVMDLGIADKVLFTGTLYGRDKLESYVDADVYVLPSRYETFPNTVLEAAACGIPVIITDQCGITDIVKGKLGYVVEFDEDKLKNAMSKVLSDKDRSIKDSFEGIKFVKEQFNWSTVIKQIENTYKSC